MLCRGYNNNCFLHEVLICDDDSAQWLYSKQGCLYFFLYTSSKAVHVCCVNLNCSLNYGQVRHGYKYEGEVFYFLDGSSNVIGLLKKKTAW